MCKKNISVIVPVYNGEKTIERCLQSLLSQKYRDFVILIINDGSVDNTEKVLKKYEKNSKIRIWNRKKNGVSAARNFGIKMATSKYISFVDADDEVSDTFLLDLVSSFDKLDIDLSVCGLTRIYRKKRYTSHYKNQILSAKNMLSYVFDNNGPRGYLYNKMWKNSIIKKYNLKLNTNVSMAEDLLFTVEYLLYAKKVNINNKLDYFYYVSHNGLSSGIDFHKKNNKNYKKPFFSYLLSAKLIMKDIPDNYFEAKKNARTNYLLVNSDFIRQICLNGDDVSNRYLIKKLKKNTKNNLHDIITSKIITNKRKIGFFLSIYLTNVMKMLDKYRFKLRG